MTRTRKPGVSRRATLAMMGAGADPARGKPSANPPDAGIERGIGDVLTAVFQRTAIRRPSGVKRNDAR